MLQLGFEGIAMIGRTGGPTTAASYDWQAVCYTQRMTNDTVSIQRRLPDTEKCQTSYVAHSELSQCLVENPDACQYATRFGSGVICRHPQRRSFENPQDPG
jgi:hypothetical protein